MRWPYAGGTRYPQDLQSSAVFRAPVDRNGNATVRRFAGALLDAIFRSRAASLDARRVLITFEGAIGLLFLTIRVARLRALEIAGYRCARRGRPGGY
jgi:hypothetical protein